MADDRLRGVVTQFLDMLEQWQFERRERDTFSKGYNGGLGYVQGRVVVSLRVDYESFAELCQAVGRDPHSPMRWPPDSLPLPGPIELRPVDSQPADLRADLGPVA